MPIAFLHRLLAHPLTAGLSLDDPSTTELRREVIFSKPFLKAIYDEWYRMLAAEVPAGPGAVLELGSGAGYCDLARSRRASQAVCVIHLVALGRVEVDEDVGVIDPEEVVVAEGWWRKRGAPGVADRGVTGRASLMRR